MTITFQDAKRISGLSTDTLETITLSDDFSSYGTQAAADAVWQSSNTSFHRVNIASDKLDFNMSGSEVPPSKQITADLGAVDNANWVTRFKINISSFNNASYGGIFTMAISSADYSVSQATAQNGIGFYIYKHAGNTHLISGTSAFINNVSAYNLNYNGWATGTDYYIQLSRENTTTIRIKVSSTAAHDGDIVNATTATTSAVNNLRYWKLMNYGYVTGSTVGTIDNVQFWNGVNSVNSKPTNVASGSIFLETDAGKRYFSDGSNWVAEV